MNFERGIDPKISMDIGSKLFRAKAELEVRRKKAYEEIEASGDKVLGDNSFIGTDWVTGDPRVFMGIITRSMVEDLKNMHSIDVEAELKAILPPFVLNK